MHALKSFLFVSTILCYFLKTLGTQIAFIQSIINDRRTNRRTSQTASAYAAPPSRTAHRSKQCQTVAASLARLRCAVAATSLDSIENVKEKRGFDEFWMNMLGFVLLPKCSYWQR